MVAKYSKHSQANRADLIAALTARDEHAALVSSELFRLSSIAKLAAFACEARRVLVGIEQMESAGGRETFFSDMGEWVEARCQWADMPDTSADVLADVGQRLHELAMLDLQPSKG